jgi:hypothetical protein
MRVDDSFQVAYRIHRHPATGLDDLCLADGFCEMANSSPGRAGRIPRAFSLKVICNWLVKNGRVTHHPVAHVAALNPDADVRRRLSRDDRG